MYILCIYLGGADITKKYILCIYHVYTSEAQTATKKVYTMYILGTINQKLSCHSDRQEKDAQEEKIMAKLTDSDKFKQLDKKTTLPRKGSIIKKISSGKSQLISVKVNPQKYEQFKNINRHKGVSNNSIINLLIDDYIRKNMAEMD